MNLPDAKSGKKWYERETIGFGFTSDWMTKWREFWKAIADRGIAKQNQVCVTFDIHVKRSMSSLWIKTGDEK